MSDAARQEDHADHDDTGPHTPIDAMTLAGGLTVEETAAHVRQILSDPEPPRPLPAFVPKDPPPTAQQREYGLSGSVMQTAAAAAPAPWFTTAAARPSLVPADGAQTQRPPSAVIDVATGKKMLDVLALLVDAEGSCTNPQVGDMCRSALVAVKKAIVISAGVAING